MPGPHDLFARYTFGQPERAAAELRAVLPPRIVSQVDWSSLKRESGSVVDPELRETESDLLFSVRLRGGRPLLLYVLLEHQSSVDGWMALRMLRYVVRQLEHWRKAHPGSERLPMVVPLVMYHGPDGAWSAPRQVEELFDLPDLPEEQEEWRALVPRFEYLLDDLTSERAEALMARPGPPLARLALLLLRYGRTEELTRRLPDWVALFAEVHATPHGDEELGLAVRYLFQVGDRSVRTAMRAVLRSVMETHRAEDLMRSYGDELMERGMRRGLAKGLEQGLEQGRAQGLAQGVLRVLAVRHIAVDEQARQHILTCTEVATLERWLERALTATTVSEVLGGVTQ